MLWQDLRKTHIGGSEIGSLFGCGYMTAYQLWHSKSGNYTPPSLDDDERVQAGQFLENGVIQWANRRWGVFFYQPKVYVKHPVVEGMGCTPDAFTSGLDSIDVTYPNQRIAQIKVVDSLQFCREWEFDGDTITHAPLHIMLQCHHEMACCRAEENWLIVLVGGNRLYRMVVQHDEEVIHIIERKVKDFWKSIRDGNPPSPDFIQDGNVIRQLRSKLSIIERVDLSGDSDLYNLLVDLKGQAHTRKLAADAEDRLKNKLIHVYGEYEFIKCGDMTATIKPDKNGHIRLTIGSEKLAI